MTDGDENDNTSDNMQYKRVAIIILDNIVFVSTAVSCLDTYRLDGRQANNIASAV